MVCCEVFVGQVGGGDVTVHTGASPQNQARTHKQAQMNNYIIDT